MIRGAEGPPEPIRKTKAFRLGRIANNAGQLPDGVFEAGHRKVTVTSTQDSKHVVVDKYEGEITTWRSTVDVSFVDGQIPFIAASWEGLVLDDTFSSREYSAAETTAHNDMCLYEVARSVRVAGRLCIEPNMVEETTEIESQQP